MSESNGAPVSDPQDTLLVAGMSLIAIGAGVLMSHPGIREQAKKLLIGAAPELEHVLSGNTVGGVIQDLERYMKIRSM